MADSTVVNMSVNNKIPKQFFDAKVFEKLELGNRLQDERTNLHSKIQRQF